MNVTVSWTDFKNFVSVKNLSPQYLESDDTYYVRYYLNGLEGMCVIYKDEGVEVTDFEENYKNNYDYIGRQ